MRSFGVLAEAIENFKNPVPAGMEEEFAEEGEFAEAPGRFTGVAETTAGTARAAGGLTVGVSRMKDGPQGVIVLTVDGAVDSSTSEEFESRLERCVAEHPTHFVLDLSDTIYISSSGWGIVIKYMQQLGDSGGRLALAGMNSIILKIFRDLGFEPLIPQYSTLERALAELAPAKSMPERAHAGVETADSTKEKPDLASALLGKADITPLEPLKPVKEAEKVIFIDFKKKKDIRTNTDTHIKEMGWEEYGKKLSESEKNPKHRKK
jgi:anti-sigma B factor antagonist